MKLQLNWNQKMHFTSQIGELSTPMDARAPLGDGKAMNPKELVAAGLAGCTAMDVIALFKKYKEIPDIFYMDVEIKTTETGYPAVFTHVLLKFFVEGNVSKETFISAVVASQTKYCGVSAMLSKAVPIEYELYLNNQKIYNDKAKFD